MLLDGWLVERVRDCTHIAVEVAEQHLVVADEGEVDDGAAGDGTEARVEELLAVLLRHTHVEALDSAIPRTCVYESLCLCKYA